MTYRGVGGHMRKDAARLLLLMLLFLAVALQSEIVYSATFTVNDTGDAVDANPGNGVCATAGGVCTLRAAIQEANALAGTDTINFNIAGAGPHTITPASALPAITQAVIIDGTSEPDYVTNGNRPIVVLDGNGLAADGLVLASGSGGSTIRGLVIRDFGTTTAHDGIEIQAGSDGNAVAGNYIGRLTTTGADAGAGEVTTGQGINILSANNIVDGNVISGNWAGVLFSGSGASGNVVVRNLIGTDATGTVLIGNSSNGVDIGNGAPNNTIGGVGAGNFIVGSGNDGITIWGAGATGNKVQGNTIGTDATGSTWVLIAAKPRSRETSQKRRLHEVQETICLLPPRCMT